MWLHTKQMLFRVIFLTLFVLKKIKLLEAILDEVNLCVFLMNNYSGNETVNAGTEKELTIKKLTKLVAKVIGYEGNPLGIQATQMEC